MSRSCNILFSECVLPNIKAGCKREALRAIARRASTVCDVSEATIISSLLEREKLGSTGVGDGVAIPHAKLPGLSKIVGLMARLEEPVDFDALDAQPVDLIFVLLAPENATAAHLKALAQVSRLLRDDEVRDALRGAESADAIYAIITADRRHDAA